MSESVTTSIRLSPKLRRALDLKARQQGRGKNWIISQALESYLKEEGLIDLQEEARRQSVLASQSDKDDWTAAADLDQWR